MSTVRCPSCRRALNLPDATFAETARCPVCESVFRVADLEAPRPRPPQPTIPPAPVGAREVPLPRAAARDLADEPSFDGEARRGLGRAAGWLRAMVALGMVQLVTCGLCGCLEVESGSFLAPGQSTAFRVYVAWLIARFFALAFVWSATERLSGRRGLRTARAGAIVALAYAVLTILITLPAAYTMMEELGRPGTRRTRRVPPTEWVSLSFTYLTALCGVIGSVLALRQLARAEVERAFKR